MIYQDIENYQPFNEQEEHDKQVILKFLDENDDAFYRENEISHMTASSWIVNKDRTKVLMCYHNIYNSWSWTGGHCDGDEDCLAVAIREAKEETGITHIKPISEDIYSLEILTVEGHVKRGKYVSSHTHMNVTYLLEADDSENIRMKEDENSGVAWFTLEEAKEKSTEPWFVEHIYDKLNEKLKDYKKEETE